MSANVDVANINLSTSHDASARSGEKRKRSKERIKNGKMSERDSLSSNVYGIASIMEYCNSSIQAKKSKIENSSVDTIWLNSKEWKHFKMIMIGLIDVIL